MSAILTRGIDPSTDHMTVDDEVLWLGSHVVTGKVGSNLVFLKKKRHSMVDFTHVLIRFNCQKRKRFHMIALR
jgi:hypothetical protein